MIILSASQRRLTDPHPLPAIERYEGVYFRLVKKHLREGRLSNMDIIIVSEKHGIVRADENVPYITPFRGKLHLPEKQLEELKQTNLSKLGSIFNQHHYKEIFVVCGREYRKLIEGFEQLTDAKVVFCKGAGLGPKAQDLKRWILTIR
jgi:hypothetical protein